MRAIFLALASIGLLAGCADMNTEFSNLQLSGAAEPFPSNYRDIAATAISGLPTADGRGRLQVSAPQAFVGSTPFDPKRWYVCVRGLRAPSAGDDYDAIIFIDNNTDRPPWVTKSFHPELCQNLAYEALSPRQ